MPTFYITYITSQLHKHPITNIIRIITSLIRLNLALLTLSEQWHYSWLVLRIVAISFLTIAVVLAGFARAAVLCVHEDGYSHVELSSTLTEKEGCHSDCCHEDETDSKSPCMEQRSCTDLLLEMVELPLSTDANLRSLVTIPPLCVYMAWEIPVLWKSQTACQQSFTARAPPRRCEWLHDFIACTVLRT